MNRFMNSNQANDIYNRLVEILSSGDSWRARASKMRGVFDLLLNYMSPVKEGKPIDGQIQNQGGGFWKNAIDNLFDYCSDNEWRDELHHLRMWFNCLAHPMSSGYSKKYRDYERRTVLDAMETMADFTCHVSGCPIPGAIIGACRKENRAVKYRTTTVVFLCELYSSPKNMAEAPMLIDALVGIPLEKTKRDMSDEVRFHSVVYTPSLLQFSDKDRLSDEHIVEEEPVNRAIAEALAILRNSKSEHKWLVWRAAHPNYCNDDSIRAINSMLDDGQMEIALGATTREAYDAFNYFWNGRRVYKCNPRLPGNLVSAIMETIVSRNQ